MSEIRIEHGHKCCGNCAYWGGNKKIEQNWTTVDQSQTAKCCKKNASCSNSLNNCHHGNCSNYEAHPMARK